MADPMLESLARAAAIREGIPAELFLGLIKTESNWMPTVKSSAGAIGLSQVMPFWASTPAGRAVTGLERVEDLFDPEKNLTAGARILAAEIRQFGNPALALMAYNAGSAAVNKAAKKAGSNDPAAVSQYLPAAETRAYWKKVLTWAAHYAGEISAVDARQGAASGNLPGKVAEWVKRSVGASGLLILFSAALAGAIILGGRR
jgi:soluble lytic murein transglycosylase-like protein